MNKNLFSIENLEIDANSNKGFTLIEILIVVAIIGMLAAIVMASINAAKTKTQNASVKYQFKQIEQQINNVRDTQNKTMKQITGSSYTEGAFNFTTQANTQPVALATNAANWAKFDYATPPVDPWGTPYTFDENELEINNADCRNDLLVSAGPDGIFKSPTPTPDDITYNVIHFVCPN